MKNLQIINEQEVLGKEFRVYGTADSPLFLAKDVAEWIEHNQVSRMIEMVDSDEKLMCLLSTSGQNREMWFLTEDGFYEVLMQSRKPIAKQFKKQVKEIMKTIRKTGSYNIDSYMIDDPLQRATKWIEEKTEALHYKEEVFRLEQEIQVVENHLEMEMDSNGMSSKETYRLSRSLLNKLSELDGCKITAKDAVYKRATSLIFKKYNAKRWEDISVHKYSNVYADIDSIDDTKYIAV